MLVVVLIVLCIALFAAVLLQTMRLRALQQQMDKLRRNAETAVYRQETLWHDMVHDLRNPAACVFTLANLIQENRDGDPKQLNHFLDEIHKSSSQVLQVLAERVPPRLNAKSLFEEEPAVQDSGSKVTQKEA